MQALRFSCRRNNGRNKAAFSLARARRLSSKEVLMAWKTWDWKFVATSVIAIAALVIPQIDLSSRSLTVRLLSSAALQPAQNIQNLQISLNGQNVESPYVSTIELANTGSKPITSADFDGALKILISNDAKLVSAEITKTTPKNIPVQVSTSADTMAISPFLSNTKDSVTIAAITSGPRPELEVRARIVGVNEVPLEDTTVQSSSHLQALYGVAIAIGLVFLYFIYGPIAFRNNVIVIPRGLSLCTSIVCALAGARLLTLNLSKEFFAGLPYAETWAIAAALLSIALVAVLAFKYLRRLIRIAHVHDRS